MPFKVSYFWKQQSELEGGWSENFWMAGTDAAAAETQALAARNLMNQIKGYGAWCPRIRFSDPAVFRSGYNKRIPGAAPAAGAAAQSADYPTTKWLLKMKGATTTVSQWFGGVEDLSVEFGAINRAAVTITRDFARLKALMVGPGSLFRIRVLDPTVLAIPILSVDPATGLVTVGAHNFLTTNKVRISRVNGVTAANGIWRVIVPLNSTNTFNLAGWIPQTTPFAKSPSATVRLQSYTYQQLADMTIERATSHKVGRPTDLLGGRRKTRKR